MKMKNWLLTLMIFVCHSLFADAPYWSDWHYEDSVIVKCAGNEQKTLDLRIEPDTMYRKLLFHIVDYGVDNLNDSALKVMSDRESYFTLAKQVLTECKCDKESGCSYLKFRLVSSCKNREYLNLLAEILYEQQDELVLLAAWENFDRKRCPWYESFRDSVVLNKKKCPLCVLIAVSHNAKDYKESSYLMDEFKKKKHRCEYEKCFQYLIDNNDVMLFSEYKFFNELWIHDSGYWGLEMDTYANGYANDFIKDPLCYLILGKLQDGVPMFVTSLSCESELTQQRILLDLEIPIGNRFDLDKCIETIERETPVDKELKKKVLKALRKTQGN